MKTLSLGIVAHVDAGKTSLTERLLFATGVLDEIGSVDAGSTQTDSLALERARGITIRAAVVSFVIDDVTVNLLDTPGHPDFIAEVERVLGVLDGAVLVVSAVEGVQPQTRVLMRTLQRLRIPTLVFVNKIDRSGARYDGVLRSIGEQLTPVIVAMGSVSGLGTRSAAFSPSGRTDTGFTSRLVDLLAEGDDAFLAAYVQNQAAVTYRRLLDELTAQTGRGRVHPVFFGSAITGAGVEALMAGIARLLPASEGNVDGPLSGTVFKVDRGPTGDKIAYVRMFSGSLHVRDRLQVLGDDAKVTGISVFDGGAAVRRACVVAGQIAQVWGLDGVQIGDAVGLPPPRATGEIRGFAPPSLETVVVPVRPADKGVLHVALGQLAEQDPLIALRQDEAREEIAVSLYGEVQKEVLQATLADEFGVDVTFRETTTICIERPVGTGAAVEMIGTDANPFLATVGLRVDPTPTGTGVRFRLGVELGSMPYAFMRAVEETVDMTLQQGLAGWQVTDCTVTLTHSGYWPRQSHAHGTFDKSMSSTAGDFRGLTPLVLMSALQRAGTGVHEPVHRFALEIPAETYGAVLPVLAQLRAVPHPPTEHGTTYLLAGTIPAARVHDLRQRLPTLTSGEGVLESAFDHYQPVHGAAPTRPRTGADPLDRRAYLLRVQRRV
ncbi:MAG: GTP-binding protein [Mycobacteriales bacterium]